MQPVFTVKDSLDWAQYYSEVMHQVYYLFCGSTVLNGLKSTYWMELFLMTQNRFNQVIVHMHQHYTFII